jgi:hypothetical protein
LAGVIFEMIISWIFPWVNLLQGSLVSAVAHLGVLRWDGTAESKELYKTLRGTKKIKQIELLCYTQV